MVRLGSFGVSTLDSHLDCRRGTVDVRRSFQFVVPIVASRIHGAHRTASRRLPLNGAMRVAANPGSDAGLEQFVVVRHVATAPSLASESGLQEVNRRNVMRHDDERLFRVMGRNRRRQIRLVKRMKSGRIRRTRFAQRAGDLHVRVLVIALFVGRFLPQRRIHGRPEGRAYEAESRAGNCITLAAL